VKLDLTYRLSDSTIFFNQSTNQNIYACRERIRGAVTGIFIFVMFRHFLVFWPRAADNELATVLFSFYARQHIVLSSY